MDYKEKYEALLANIKAYHARFGPTCNLKKELEECVPELRVSEEERISNLVYCVIRDTPEVARVLSANGVYVNDALDLLERLFSANKCKQDANNPANKPANTDEDEMMRKSLIEYLKTKDHECDHWVAWLEKRKEQKPADRVFTFDDVLALESAMALAKDDKELHGALKSIFERVHDAYHGEQQPAEWTDADENILERIINRQTFIIPIPAKDPVGVVFKRREDTEAINWLKRRLASRPQPKQEWGEKDEKMRKSIINILGQNTDAHEEGWAIFADEIAWLKAIHPQPKQEWSEGDERILKRLIRDYDEAVRSDNGGPWGKVFQENLAWLKSRRPQPNNNLRWRRATDGANIPESIIIPDGEEPRFGKCAVKNSYYIPVEELKNLPKDES